MIRWYHWTASLILHVGIICLYVAPFRENGETEPSPHPVNKNGTKDSIQLTMTSSPSSEKKAVMDSPALEEIAEPVPPPEMPKGRQRYEAVTGDLQGERDSSSGTTVGSAMAESGASLSTANTPTEPQATIANSPSEWTYAVTPSEQNLNNPSVSFGNTTFAGHDGEAVPGFVITNLDPSFLDALAGRGDLLLVATMGNRNVRFSGSPINPTTAQIDDFLDGYSERGLEAPAHIRRSAWQVLSREFGYREGQRDSVQIDFLLSQRLDQVIRNAQHDAAHQLQKPLHDLRVTHGRLLHGGNGYRFIIERIE